MAASTPTTLTDSWQAIQSAGAGTKIMIQPFKKAVRIEFGTSTPASTDSGFLLPPQNEPYVLPVPTTSDVVYAVADIGTGGSVVHVPIE